MQPEHWQQIKALLATSDALVRAELLAQLPADGQALVAQLIANEQQMGDFLVAPLFPVTAALSSEFTGLTIGQYQVEREIGRGGMGVVYLAHRADDVYQRQVAIKLVFPTLDTPAMQARFHRERLILARLDHPYIARIIDGGATMQGWSYLVMDYVQGVPIDEWCRTQNLSLPERLLLLQQVCQAVEHAHQHLVVHRDIKPSNLLITADGTPRLLDFGIARILDPQEQSSTLTRSALHFLTPEYASPEQLRGETVTTASDVYSLGVLLFQLLTERRPFQLQALSLVQMLAVVSQSAPPLPSSVLPSERSGWRKQVVGDLDNITLRALRTEPEQRYASVAQLREDLERQRTGQPVLARPTSRWYRSRKWMQRHPALATLLALLSLLLVTSSVFFGWQARVAQAQALQERQLRYAAQMHQAGYDLTEGKFGALRSTLENFLPRPGAADLRGFEWYYLWQQAHPERFRLEHPGWVYSVAYSPDGKLLATGCHDGTVRLWDTTTGQMIRTLSGHHYPIGVICFSPDGRWLATTAENHIELKLWEVSTGKEIASSAQGRNAVAFAPDGAALYVALDTSLARLETSSLSARWRNDTRAQVLALLGTPDGKTVLSSGDDGRVTAWDASTGQRESSFVAHQGYVFALALSPDGQTLLTGGGDKAAKLWDLSTKRLLAILSGHTSAVRGVSFSPDGKYLVTASADRTMKLWDATTYAELHTWHGHEDRIRAVAFAPDSRSLATASDDRTARIWAVPPPQDVLTGHQARIFSLAMAPDGKTLASTGSDHTIKFWEAETGQAQLSFAGHAREMYTIAFAPEGTELATTSQDQTVKVWDRTGKNLATLQAEVKVPPALLFQADGKLTMLRYRPHELALVDVMTRQTLMTFAEPGAPILKYAISANGQWVVAVREDQVVKIWKAHTGQLWLQFTAPGGKIRGIFLSPHGNRLVITSAPHFVQDWDLAHKRLLATTRQPLPSGWGTIFATDETLQLVTSVNTYLKSPAGAPRPQVIPLLDALTNLTTMTFSPQGERLLLGNRFGTLQLWDVPKRQLITAWQGGTSIVYDVQFSPDGQTVGVASGDGFVRLYALTGQLLRAWQGHTRETGMLVFSPDGKQLSSSGFDGRLNSWELATGQQLFQQQLFISQGGAISLDYAPNGKFLAAGYDQATILWERGTPQPRFILRGQTDAIWGVRFSPDSQLLATASWDSTVNLWDTETGQERAHLTGHTASVTAVAFAPDGKLLATGSHDHTIKLWDTRTGTLVRTLTGPGDQVLTVAFSPDGQRLAAAGADTRIYLFDVSSGQELLTLRGHTDEVWSLVFAPDGRTLYSGSWDKTIRIWRTAPASFSSLPTP